MSDEAKCALCGEPMPAGEEMFKYHGFSGPCPKPPLPKPAESVGMRLWSWFDDASQGKPTYDPPYDAPCPYCLAPITEADVRTHSLMMAGPTCDEDANSRGDGPGNEKSMDNRIFDAIAKVGD